MIYTITFNPSVCIDLDVDEIRLGAASPAQDQRIRYGSGGIDVSRTLLELGRPSTAWGFLAGPVGRAMDEQLQVEGLDCQFVMVPEGDLRVKVRLNTVGIEDGDMRAASAVAACGLGPVADKVSQLHLFSMLQSTADGDLLVVSGDVPGNVSSHAYARIIESQKDKKVPVVVDGSGELMLNTLQHNPFLVKVEAREACELVGGNPADREACLQGARLLRELGARNVIVWSGPQSHLFVDERDVVREPDPALAQAVVARQPLGSDWADDIAGCRLLAGFVHGYLQGLERGIETDALYDHAYALGCDTL